MNYLMDKWMNKLEMYTLHNPRDVLASFLLLVFLSFSFHALIFRVPSSACDFRQG